MIWKLFRLDAFNEKHIYYIEGSKADLFAFIGYIYSCFELGTKRIDYKRVPAIPTDECSRCFGRSDDYEVRFLEELKEE